MGAITMSKKESYEFRIVNQFLLKKLSRLEAAELLSVNPRTISRKSRRVEELGIIGIKHSNCLKAPINKTCETLKVEVMSLVEKEYFDFNLTHMNEMLTNNHGYKINYYTLRRWCHEKNLVKRKHKRRKSAPRSCRQRKLKSGMMLQMDGSPHFYVPGKEWVLVAGIDDATNEVPYGEFFPRETTQGYFNVLDKTIEKKGGMPFSVYVDRAGCLGGGKRVEFGQFVRACEELDCHVLFANSPQAKGRIERFWQVVQDRCVAEFRLNKITTVKEANHYFNNVFLKRYWNAKKVHKAEKEESGYLELKANISLKEVFCFKHQRKINYDHTIKWKHKTYQLYVKSSIAKQVVEIRVYSDQSFKCYFAGREISYSEVKKKVSRKSA